MIIMKKTWSKILIGFLIFLILFNFTLTSDAYNNNPVEGSIGAKTTTAENAFNTMYNLLVNTLGAFVGFMTWGIRVGVFAVCAAAQMLISGVVSLGGVTKSGVLVTPFTIFFNQVPLLDVDFMDFKPASNEVKEFRTQVATWYYVMRIIATAILLLILVYIGIRMAISTIASDKAVYQKMLTDWAASLALLYLLHYFILFVIKLNGTFIEILKGVGGAEEHLTNFTQYISTIALQSVSGASGFNGIVSTIVYALIVFQTLKFLVIYLKRMITVGFLIIISPLITITYSIDKIGDQKAQALNTWMKEFCYNILIQPFHCIMYLAFVDVAFTLIKPDALDIMFDVVSFIPGLNIAANVASTVKNTATASNTLAAGILAIVCIQFISEGEKIIRKIFGFDKASSLGDIAAATAMVGTFANKAGSIGKTLSKAGVSSKNMFKGTMSKVSKDVSNLGKITKGVGNAVAGSKLGKAVSNSGVGKMAGAIGSGVSSSVADGVNNVKNKASSVKKKATAKFGTAKTFEERRNEYVNGKNGKKGAAQKMAEKDGRDWSTMSDPEKQMYKNNAEAKFGNRERAKYNAKNAAKCAPKKVIYGVKGSITGKIHDTGYLSSVAAASAGLATYAISGGALASILTATGAYSASKEFLKNTKGQLGKDVSEALQTTSSVTSQEYKSDETKLAHLKSVKIAGDNGRFDTKELTAEFKRLTAEFQTRIQGLSQQQAELITANLQNKLATNPNGFNFETDLKESIDSVVGKDRFENMSQDSQDTISNKAKDYLTTYSNAKLYNILKTAETAGFQPEDLVSKVSSTKVIHRVEHTETTEKVEAADIDSAIQSASNDIDKVVNAAATDINNVVNNVNEQISRLENSSGNTTLQQQMQIEGLRSQLDAKIAEFEHKNNTTFR